MLTMICQDCGHKGIPKGVNFPIFLILFFGLFIVGGVLYLLLVKKSCKNCGSSRLLPVSHIPNKEIQLFQDKQACKHCSEIIDHNATYCPHCSHYIDDTKTEDNNKQYVSSDPINKKICPHCLHHVNANASFCQYCNATLLN